MPALTATAGAGFRFILLTDDEQLAADADRAGVERIGIDIERLGKPERQAHVGGMRISAHQVEALPRLRRVVSRAALFARCNPLHADSRREIDDLIAAGASELMLPFFDLPAQVARFVDIVEGRARVVLLLETAAAAAHAGEIAAVPGVSEIVVGLNDLRLAFGLRHPLELFLSPELDRIVATVRDAGVPCGAGGLADPLNQALPVDPTLVYAAHARLGTRSGFIARQFTAEGLTASGFSAALARCRAELDRWVSRGLDEQLEAREQLRRALGRGPA